MRAAALGVGRCGGTGLAPRNPRNPPIQTRPLKRVIILFHGFSWACVTTFRNLSFFFGFADFRLLCMRVGNVHIPFFLFLDKTRLHVQSFLPRRWIPSHCSDFCGAISHPGGPAPSCILGCSGKSCPGLPTLLLPCNPLNPDFDLVIPRRNFRRFIVSYGFLFFLAWLFPPTRTFCKFTRDQQAIRFSFGRLFTEDLQYL